MSPPSLTLLLPELELLLPEGREWPPMPTLQRLLSRADHQPLSDGHYAGLMALLGLRGDEAAPLRALGEGLASGEGWWLCADPVHLVADRDQLYLSAHRALAIRQDEADRLIASLNHLYADEEWRFHAPAPDRWYLQLPAARALTTTPTEQAMGSPVGEVLPTGPDAMVWQRVMTECQMLLHSESVNIEREAEGQPAINSLWFWGGGKLPAPGADVQWRYVVADDPLLLGLAVLHGVETLPQEAALKEGVASQGDTLWQAQADSLEALETQVLAPLMGLLQSGELSQLALWLPGRGVWSLERKMVRRWWRRNRPLSSLLGRSKA
ncbi:MAG: hypothetical protein ACQETD_10410 [Pseudomonadota bacterium]